MEKVIRLGLLMVGLLLSIAMISTVTKIKFEQLKSTQFTTSKDVVSIRDRERQLDCLAKNIYYEAGSEPFEGKVAVAQVTLNRAASGKFPSDICGVVYQKSIIMERVVCQFSWYCQNGGKPIIRSREAFNESMEVAKKVLLEGFRLDIMKTAMYFHGDYVQPNWGKPKIGQIGRHIFYRD